MGTLMAKSKGKNRLDLFHGSFFSVAFVERKRRAETGVEWKGRQCSSEGDDE